MFSFFFFLVNSRVLLINDRLEQQNPATAQTKKAENDFLAFMRCFEQKKNCKHRRISSHSNGTWLVLNVLSSRLFLCACRHRHHCRCWLFFCCAFSCSLQYNIIIFSLLKIHIRILCLMSSSLACVFFVEIFIGCRSDGISIINSTKTQQKKANQSMVCELNVRTKLHRPLHPLSSSWRWPFFFLLLFIKLFFF